MSSLVVTTNEHTLINVIHDVPDFPLFNTQNLAVGDIAIFDENGHPKCLIERKTVTDLINSFGTGRYADQRNRMLDVRKEHPECQLVYFIEGKIEKAFISQVTGCEDKLQRYFNIQVISTESIEDTVQRIKYYWNQHNSSSTRERVPVPPMVRSMTMKPADLLTPEKWFMHALSIIPSLSITKARAICNVYPNVENIIEEIKINDITNISKLKVNERSIGTAVSNKIKNCILGTIDKKELVKSKKRKLEKELTPTNKLDQKTIIDLT